MILDLKKSKLFEDPDERFCKEYLLPGGTWKEMWRRYKLLDYSKSELIDYLFIKHARKMSPNSIDRWIVRSEVFQMAKPKLDMGVQYINSNIFEDYEQFVLDELTKNLRFSGTDESKVII